MFKEFVGKSYKLWMAYLSDRGDLTGVYYKSLAHDDSGNLYCL